MATRKRNKEAEAWKLEVDEIDRQVRERREEIKELLARRQKIVERHEKRRPVSWDDDSPMTKLIDMTQFERLKAILTEWQPYSKTTILPKRTTHFEFDVAYRKMIVLALKDGWDGDVPLFVVSQRQVLKYLSMHSNLGKLDTLKKILYRNK